ncbi:MAG: radical SAM protein [Halobacteriota archaeon]|nr:radical SAM protein [Halobacteriota archaeon]
MTSNKPETEEMLKSLLDLTDPRLTKAFFSWAQDNPRYMQTFIRLIRTHYKTRKLRADCRAEGVVVPAFLILSITSQCNLGCAGCFAAATGTLSDSDTKRDPLDYDQWKKILTEASDMGVFFFVIAGGEPFMYQRVLDLCESFDDRFFLIITNATAIKEDDYEHLKHISNVAIIASIEGDKSLTDDRRGNGTYDKAMTSLNYLQDIGALTGISVTITRMNYEYWMKEEHLDTFVEDGVRLIAFLEYIPLSSSSDEDGSDHFLMLTSDERKEFRSRILDYRKRKQVYIIHSPGDEEFFGGCVSAGRGFAHITPSGDLTPCPISNIATHNLTKSTLREGLASQLFEEIRRDDRLLETDGMPCALFAHPKEVDALAKSVGAYRTGYKGKHLP